MRLLVVAEGLTEVSFVTQVLKPHLEQHDSQRITVSAPNLKGHYTYTQLKKFVKNLLASETPVMVTTMLDLFKIPGDFPGLAETVEDSPIERVRKLEQHCTRDIADGRFFAYLQLHEFEALLLANLEVLSERHPNRRREITHLAARLNREFQSPEHVDRLRPPSYWIKDAVPEYNKVGDGPTTAAGIGLSTICERCPHFGEWLEILRRAAIG